MTFKKVGGCLNNCYVYVFLFFLSFSVHAVPTDYLVLSWTEQDGLVSEYHQIVDLPANRPLKVDADDRYNIQLVGFDGQNVGHVSMKNALLTRSEFHGEEHIDGRVFENEEVTFVIRIQQGLVKQLILPKFLNANKSFIDFEALVRGAKKQGPQIVKSTRAGADNRINLLFMGDGYTSGQSNDFNADVDAVIAYMETFEPYQSYANFTSYDRLFTASSQSGADKPSPCFSPASFVNTAFDAKYCTSNIERLLTVNSTKVLTAAAANPNWDEIAVVVNDGVYGGSGGFFSTFSTHAFSDDIFIHEYGHSFTGLADEYDSPYPGYPACSDISGSSPCEANVTDVTTRNNIKWNHLIAGATPVPTPDIPAYSNSLGLFEGARYLSSGMYRPVSACNMRVLGYGFCAVCQEAYVHRVYEVLYAQGNTKLSLIEPDSAVPVSQNPSGMVATPMNFSVMTLQPSHDLSVTWYVAGVSQGTTQSSQVTQSFQFTPANSGNVEVKVRVKDNSSLVDASQHGSLPHFEHVWQVNVQPLVDLIFENGFE